MHVIDPGDEVDKEHDDGNKNVEDIGVEDVGARNVLASPDAHPPNVDHCVVAAVLVVQIIKYPSDMTVAIVAENVVHSLFVGKIGLSDRDVVLFLGVSIKVQFEVLVGFSKCEVIN